MSVIGKNTRENIGGKKNNKRNVKLLKEEYMTLEILVAAVINKVSITILNEYPPKEESNRQFLEKVTKISNILNPLNYIMDDKNDD